tara:strand:+ start:1954 stop:2103 length:150 start_codon:yes stop_codon:yes gene_type:complete
MYKIRSNAISPDDSKTQNNINGRPEKGDDFALFTSIPHFPKYLLYQYRS